MPSVALFSKKAQVLLVAAFISEVGCATQNNIPHRSRERVVPPTKIIGGVPDLGWGATSSQDSAGRTIDVIKWDGKWIAAERDRLMVGFRPEVPEDRRRSILAAFNLAILDQSAAIHYYFVGVEPGPQLYDVARRLAALPEVEYAEPNTFEHHELPSANGDISQCVIKWRGRDVPVRDEVVDISFSQGLSDGERKAIIQIHGLVVLRTQISSSATFYVIEVPREERTPAGLTIFLSTLNSIKGVLAEPVGIVEWLQR